MSNRARFRCGSPAWMLMPPIRSALFSWLAIQRAAALEAAPWLRANTLAPRALRREKGVGVDADEQVGLHALCLLHAHLQGHKEVGVAGEVGPHRAAFERGGVDAFTQTMGDPQDHILFAGAAGPDGTGVFPTVSGVERDDDQALGGAFQHGFMSFFLTLPSVEWSLFCYQIRTFRLRWRELRDSGACSVPAWAAGAGAGVAAPVRPAAERSVRHQFGPRGSAFARATEVTGTERLARG
jgi:hypothetical protein